MPDITYDKEIPVAVDAVYRAVKDVLERLAALSRGGEVVLSSTVGNTAETFCVPVEIALTQRAARKRSTGLTITARSTKALFPAFAGTLQTLPVSPALTIVRLDGTYHVPLGPIGSTINALALHKVAEVGLHQFLERLTNESMDAIREESSQAYRVSHREP